MIGSLTPVFHHSQLDIAIASCLNWAHSSDRTAASAIRLASPKGAAARTNGRVPRLWRWTSFLVELSAAFSVMKCSISRGGASCQSTLCCPCVRIVTAMFAAAFHELRGNNRELEVNVHLHRYGLILQREDARATLRNEMMEMTGARR